MTVAARLAAVRQELEAACRAAGRDPSEVTLVAVSKTFGPEAIREAWAAGQRDFGESYAQELRDKAAALADLPGLRWHFVGRIQSNKARYIAPVATRVHAIEALRHAKALAARAERLVPVLVAVNVGGEETKGGVAPEATLDLCAALHELPGVEVRGLMTLPPWRDDPEEVGPYFARLAALAAEGRRRGLPLEELSMGMSHDFPVAVRHGATWVRVGTAIFGQRPKVSR